MTTQEAETHTTKRACFLCSLDPHQTCQDIQLEGRIIAARERVIDGEKTPIILLDTGATRVEVQLEGYYYRSLIREFKARGDVLGTHHLPVRIYHLPNPPTTIEYKGKSRLSYKGNAYTLAVLAPDILLNITDLNQAEYCARQHLLNRLTPSTASAATIRGNLVHYSFKELLKEHDRGKFNPFNTPHDADAQDEETPLEALQRHLEQALHLHSLDMALANVSADAMRADVAPHLASLAHWYESERATLWDMPTAYAESQAAESTTEPTENSAQSGNQVRAETFLLAPEIGLRGRLDLFWQQSGRQRLLELKTGGANGQLPKHDHRWQVYGYHALLTVRRDSKMKKALATLLYSGTPGHAQAFGIPVTIREIQRVNERRNALILSHVTGIPPMPPGPSRCTRCSMLTQCQNVSSLLQWQAPETDNTATTDTSDADGDDAGRGDASAARPRPRFLTEDRDFFAQYYRLLRMEGHAGEQQQAQLWQTRVEERIERGTAITGLELQGEPHIEKDGWELSFRCTNTSELREGDEILLSNGDPITAEVVTGTIVKISSEEVIVWTRELIAHPTLIDRYDNDIVHIRTLQNLLRWLQAEPHMRDLVAGKIRPRFIERITTPRVDFNVEQNLAVERALQMQDYLLIHGPPGTGKTSVIAEIIIQLCRQGQRVLLAAFTNQAVDNMLKRLDKEGFHDYLRLGHERSVDDSIRPHLLQALIDATADPAQVRDILRTMPVIASTTATWSSDKYAPQIAASNAQNEPAYEDASLHFDVAIVDEAGQLTVPAVLGALRFAKRFILVGDEKQLPPLVLSKEAAEQGLATSLFSHLKQLDDDYMQKQPMAFSACVPLRTQYRMNKWIANFSSRVFYDNMLVAHDSVANRRLTFAAKLSRETASREAAFIEKAIHPTFPLVFLDVRDTTEQQSEPSVDATAQAETKISNAEAQAVRSLVAALLARGIAPEEIGIIAPYRAQVANIRRHLFSKAPSIGWEALPSTSPLSIDTVDRFQGGERSVIIMSFATTSEPSVESPRREFLVNPNRLNVALTRAQRKLILVGCAPALESLPTFNRLIAYCRSMNTLLTAKNAADIRS